MNFCSSMGEQWVQARGRWADTIFRSDTHTHICTHTHTHTHALKTDQLPNVKNSGVYLCTNKVTDIHPFTVSLAKGVVCVFAVSVVFLYGDGY